jgi:integrase/recombinase XerC/integrase/recombinase XerD
MKTVFELIKIFASEQDVAPNSCKLYVVNIKLFLRWVQSENKNVDNLKKSDILEYKQHLFDIKRSSLTIDSRITSLRKFYTWCDDNDYYNNIVVGIKNPKKYKGYKKDPLTIDQVNKLFDSIDTKTIIGKRDFAIISLMLRTGIRVGEVTKINIGDIETPGQNYIINIIRKGSQGNKTKISITEKSFQPIQDYLVELLNTNDDQPLFVVSAYNHNGLRISTAGLSQIIKSRLRRAGINSKRITAHSFRHTAAINLIKSGSTLHEVQLFLGHSSPNTTQIYIRAIEEEKRLDNTPGLLLDKMF